MKNLRYEVCLGFEPVADFALTNILYQLGIGCGSAGRAVASDKRNPQFPIQTLSTVEKMKMKKKEAENGTFLDNIISLLTLFIIFCGSKDFLIYLFGNGQLQFSNWVQSNRTRSLKLIKVFSLLLSWKKFTQHNTQQQKLLNKKITKIASIVHCVKISASNVNTCSTFGKRNCASFEFIKLGRSRTLFECCQRPQDLVITWVVLVLDTGVHFWGTHLGWTSGVHLWGAHLD